MLKIQTRLNLEIAESRLRAYTRRVQGFFNHFDLQKLELFITLRLPTRYGCPRVGCLSRMSSTKELALQVAKGLVEQGDGGTLMPEGTWGMRKPMTASRLVALAERMAARQGPPTWKPAPGGGAIAAEPKDRPLPSKVNNPQALPPGVGLSSKLAGADTNPIAPPPTETSQEMVNLLVDVKRALELAGGSMKLCELGQAFSGKSGSLFKPSALSWFKDRRSYFDIEDLSNGDFRMHLNKSQPAGPIPTNFKPATPVADDGDAVIAATSLVSCSDASDNSDEARRRAVDAAKALVAAGKGSTLMPEGTWGMRVCMSAARLCALAMRTGPVSGVSTGGIENCQRKPMRGRPTAALKAWLASDCQNGPAVEASVSQGEPVTSWSRNASDSKANAWEHAVKSATLATQAPEPKQDGWQKAVQAAADITGGVSRVPRQSNGVPDPQEGKPQPNWLKAPKATVNQKYEIAEEAYRRVASSSSDPDRTAVALQLVSEKAGAGAKQSAVAGGNTDRAEANRLVVEHARRLVADGQGERLMP